MGVFGVDVERVKASPPRGGNYTRTGLHARTASLGAGPAGHADYTNHLNRTPCVPIIIQISYSTGGRARNHYTRSCVHLSFRSAAERSAAVNGFDLSVITRRIDGIERHTGLNVSALK